MAVARERWFGDEKIVMDADVHDINTVMGLGKAAVEALPKFQHRSGEQSVEYAICLGRVKAGEVGRAAQVRPSLPPPVHRHVALLAREKLARELGAGSGK